MGRIDVSLVDHRAAEIKPSDLILRRPRSSRGRLEGWPQARPRPLPSFETPCCARLLRMRSVGFNSIRHPPNDSGRSENPLRGHGRRTAVDPGFHFPGCDATDLTPQPALD